MYPPPRFFPDARLNFAENMFAHGPADKTALIAAREGGTQVEQVTYRELRNQVGQLASAMRSAGIKKGDQVAAIISNSIASFVILLATTSIGAIFSSSATGISLFCATLTWRYGCIWDSRPSLANSPQTHFCG